MNVKFLATKYSPDYYEFDGEKVTAYYNGESETFDFSDFEEGDQLYHYESETILDIPFMQVVRWADRDNGELNLLLTQKSGQGHWRESDWMYADDYDPEKQYIVEIVPTEIVEEAKDEN